MTRAAALALALLVAGCATVPAKHRPDLRGELAAAEARLWLPVLARECRTGTPGTYAFVQARGLSLVSQERAFLLREATADAPATLQRIERRWDGGKPEADTHVQSVALDPGDASELAARLQQLSVRRSPARIDGGVSTDAPWFFETCLDGEFRITYAAGAAAFLMDAAEQRGLHAQPDEPSR